MPNITQIEVFNKANGLNIPLASNQPTTVSTVASPNTHSALETMITKVEKDVLINALGLDIYNELQTALNDLANADIKWRDLVDGVEYDGKVWEGLSNDYSLLAYAIYYTFINQNTQFNTAVGVAQVQSENSSIVNPAYKLTNALNEFITKYQKGFLNHPLITYKGAVQFIDWCNSDKEVYVSLYRFLNDNKEVYGWGLDSFKFYETENTFGI